MPAIFSHSGYVLSLARELSALVVFAEMRYFGASYPFNMTGSFVPSPLRLGLLSIEQRPSPTTPRSSPRSRPSTARLTAQ